MPKTVTNVLIVTGEANQIEELKIHVAAKPESDSYGMQAFCFESVLPVPENEKDPISWKKDNWGTVHEPWEGGPLICYGDGVQPYSHLYTVFCLLPELHASMEEPPYHWVHVKPALEDRLLSAQAIGFTTVASPPKKIIAALSHRYPALKLDLHVEQERADFTGWYHWHNNRLVDNVIMPRY